MTAVSFPSTKEIVQIAREYFIPVPMDETVIVKGKGAIVEDLEGKQYIDCFGGPGVVNCGHCHPQIMEAAKTQMDLLTQSPGQFITIPAAKLAQAVAAEAPAGLKKVFFCNSGAEANDGAVKLALKHAMARGKQGFGIIALEHSFHGRLSLPLALTGMPGRKKGLATYTAFPNITHIPAPYCYRCDRKYPECGLKCADAIQDAVNYRSPGEMAIFIGEPILGVGGVIVPPPTYWSKVQSLCRINNITLIIDEVFTGFGRTGKMFASEHWGISPDIMTMAKAIGGGFPLAAIIIREEVANSLTPGDHYTTFGLNNIVSSAAGIVSLQVLKGEGLIDNAAQVGELLMNGFKDLQKQSKAIGEVRGKGLMIGVELVKDQESREPAPELTKQLKLKLKEEGVLVSSTGNHDNILRFTPPLVLTNSQAEAVVQAMKSSLGAAGALS